MWKIVSLLLLLSLPAFGSATRVGIYDTIETSDLLHSFPQQNATTAQPGYLTAADWNTFSGKLTSALTTGHFFVGVAGVATDQTAAQATAALDAMVGATGATGGTKGMVPAPAAGDNVKFLTGAGTYALPSGNYSYASPNPSTIPMPVTAALGVAFTPISGVNDYTLRVEGYLGAVPSPVVIVATPQISAGTLDGQRLQLIGLSNTNTITIADGNGVSQNGPVVLGLNSVISYVWDAATNLWVETARR